MAAWVDRILAWPYLGESIGFLAGSLTTFCWIPQAVRIIRTRDTRAISLVTQALFTLGCFLWTLFGLKIGSPSITIFNVITTALAGTITILKITLPGDGRVSSAAPSSSGRRRRWRG